MPLNILSFHPWKCAEKSYVLHLPEKLKRAQNLKSGLKRNLITPETQNATIFPKHVLLYMLNLLSFILQIY